MVQELPTAIPCWKHHLSLAFHSGHEADHSPPSSAEVEEWVELYLHSPDTPSWRGAQGEHRHNLLEKLTVTQLVK
jgi:hypothetical protein